MVDAGGVVLPQPVRVIRQACSVMAYHGEGDGDGMTNAVTSLGDRRLR